MRLGVAVLALLTLPAAGLAQSAADRIARSKYIVENVGMCGDSHTPRDSKGSRVIELLQGAPLGFRPVVATPFADSAPPIAGGPPDRTASQLVYFLETGVRPNHPPPLPPMPSCRLSPADATAVAPYLRSLK